MSLRVLHVEDSPTDAKLILHALERGCGPIDCLRIDNEAAMRSALAEPRWDVVLSDWSMPGFSGLGALAVADELQPDLPFIIVSGTIGEEMAVEAMRAGADDYVLKDKLARLAPAVERELRESKERTARRDAEAALRSSEARFARLSESGIVGIAVADFSGLLRDANDAYLRMLGYTRGELLAGALRWENITTPEWRQFEPQVTEQLLSKGVTAPWEQELRRKDGSRIPVLIGVAMAEGGSAVSFIADLSELDRARRQQHFTEARFRALVEKTADGVMLLSSSAVARYVSPSFLTILGREPEALVDQNLYGIVHEDDRRAVQETLARLLGQVGGAERISFRAIHTDGSERWLEGVVSDRTRDPAIEGIVLNLHDVTEQKKSEAALRLAEEQLRQSQKMEAIGTLAGGVAHDFNNLLSVILSYSEMLMVDLQQNDDLRGDLEQIKIAGERAAALTRQLLAFSRQQIIEPKILDLNEVIENLQKMLRRLVREDVDLRTIVAPDLGRCKSDPGQIEQVIMNLVVNSGDAMPNGGRLTIETANVEFDGDDVGTHLGVKEGRYVMLAVSDNGVGMDKAMQARIFDPFFTTKAKGKGTGLGLSTVHGIVEQAGGSVWVYSEPGQGTTFKVYLPRRDEADTVSAPRPVITTLAGTETILLVEDEEQIRQVAREILQRHGYRVLEAKNAGDAIACCEEHDGTIHLLLTDVVMPQMNGRELAERLASLRPDMRVLFVSGYTDGVLIDELAAGAAFLQKPLTPTSLTRKVREVLDAPGLGPR